MRLFDNEIAEFPMTEEKIFKTANQFSIYIEKKAVEDKTSHMETVLKYCEDNMLEPADISKLINKSLKEKIGLEMMELNYLPKTPSLFK
jgi:hypothetical protein